MKLTDLTNDVVGIEANKRTKGRWENYTEESLIQMALNSDIKLFHIFIYKATDGNIRFLLNDRFHPKHIEKRYFEISSETFEKLIKIEK